MGSLVHSNILLEAGTNEVELLEFYVGSQSYGVNVLKIRQIIRFEPELVVWQPVKDPSVLGAIPFHEKVIPLIDLDVFFEVDSPKEDKKRIVVVCEFNGAVNGFVVDGTNKIHRINYEKIQSVNNEVSMDFITGATIIDKSEMLLVDFEKVVQHLFGYDPVGSEIAHENASGSDLDPVEKSKIHIICADDSEIVRKSVKAALAEAEYPNVEYYENGLRAYERIKECMEDPDADSRKYVLLTDIEMPEMDGLTLCKNVKKKYGTRIRVIILSSLISEQIMHKCQKVNADSYTSKDKFGEVINMIEKLTS